MTLEEKFRSWMQEVLRERKVDKKGNNTIPKDSTSIKGKAIMGSRFDVIARPKVEDMGNNGIVLTMRVMRVNLGSNEGKKERVDSKVD